MGAVTRGHYESPALTVELRSRVVGHEKHTGVGVGVQTGDSPERFMSTQGKIRAGAEYSSGPVWGVAL